MQFGQEVGGYREYTNNAVLEKGVAEILSKSYRYRRYVVRNVSGRSMMRLLVKGVSIWVSFGNRKECRKLGRLCNMDMLRFGYNKKDRGYHCVDSRRVRIFETSQRSVVLQLRL